RRWANLTEAFAQASLWRGRYRRDRCGSSRPGTDAGGTELVKLQGFQFGVGGENHAVVIHGSQAGRTLHHITNTVKLTTGTAGRNNGAGHIIARAFGNAQQLQP